MGGTPHREIRIVFAMGGRRYEAVGFLNEGEVSILGPEVLIRTIGENGGMIGDEDTSILAKERSFPEELKGYRLLTFFRGAEEYYFKYFEYDYRARRQKWPMGLGWIVDKWDGCALVVRRLPDSTPDPALSPP